MPDVAWSSSIDMESLWEESRGGDGFPHEALGAAVDRLLVDRLVEPEITSVVVAAVADEPYLVLEGLAARVKSPGSMARKIMAQARLAGQCSRVASQLKDTIRYTACVRSQNDVVGMAGWVVDRLVGRGYAVDEVTAIYGRGAPYKGLHATLRHVSSGVRFEVQFHSEESLAVKEGPVDGLSGLRHGGNHEDYEFYRDQRNRRTWRGRVEASRCYDRCVERSDTLSDPAGLGGLTRLGGCVVERVPGRIPKWYVASSERND